MTTEDRFGGGYAGRKLRPTARFVVRALVIACGTAGLALWGSRAAAQLTPDEAKVLAREHYERARVLADKGELGEAVAAFRRAYELSPHFSVLYSIGNSYAALGRSVEAVDTFEQYLREAEAAGKLDQARQREVEQTVAAAKERIANITLIIVPDGAEIAVDGQKAGNSPLAAPLRMNPGAHVITASLAEYQSGELSITTAAKEARTVELRLQRIATAVTRGRLTIDCPLGGVRVSIDGEWRGATPLSVPLDLAGGRHRVHFERHDAGARDTEVVIVGGQTIAVPCGLYPLRAIVLPVHRDAPARRGWLTWQRIAGLTIGTLGVAAGLTAAGLYASSSKRYRDYQGEVAALDAIYGQGPPYDATVYARQSDNDALIRSIQSADKASVGLAIGGGVLITTGVVLVATARRNATVTATPVVGLLARGVLIGGAMQFD